MAKQDGEVRVGIRPFVAGDFEAIEHIYSRSKLDELRYEKGPFELLPLSQDKSRLEALLASQVFVYDAGGIQGYSAVLNNEIRAIFVDPDYRGKGIGKQLLEHMISLAGPRSILYVAKSNLPAVTLYRNHGFQVTREFEAFYNGRSVQANEMVRE